VTLAWISPNQSGLVGFKVFRDGLLVLTTNTLGTNWTDWTVSATSNYSYTVKSLYNSGAESAASAPLNFTVPPCLQIAVSSGQPLLTWLRVTGRLYCVTGSTNITFQPEPRVLVGDTSTNGAVGLSQTGLKFFQISKLPPGITPPDTNCVYSISSTSASFGSAGGSGSVGVGVMAGNNCSWKAGTSYSWIHPSSGGSGNGNVSFTVDANTSTSSRGGTLTIAGQTLTVAQGGFPPGDLNGDGHINGGDALLMDQVLVGTRLNNDPLLVAGWGNGDLNGDGQTMAGDALLIKQTMVGARSYIVTKIAPSSRSNVAPTPVIIYGVNFPSNVNGVTIGPPVNLTLSNVQWVSPEQITAVVPAGGGIGNGPVAVSVTPSPIGVLSFAQFSNQ
jgi:hypothetical protein